MKIHNDKWLDAVCGEYLIGTLRGAARKRFERALIDEPLVSLRLKHWQGIFIPRYSSMIEVSPSPAAWQRLEREIGLARYRTPWHKRLVFWRSWAAATTAALLLAISLQAIKPTLPPTPQPPALVEIAQLAAKSDVTKVTARLSPDGRTLELQAARPVLACPTQSYELWLVPAEGGDAISIAVLGSLTARINVPNAQVGRLHAGAKLAVSVEPAGGSPTGRATGPVILLGEITI